MAKCLWGFFRDTQLMTFGWILLACLSVPFLGMHLLDDIRVLMILGLAAGVAIGLKTKVFRMLGAWVALSISTAFFVMIANESLVKAMVVAIFMILSASAVIFYKWFRHKGLAVITCHFFIYCEKMAKADRLLIEGPKEKDDEQEKDDS